MAALLNNDAGSVSTAIGNHALFSNTTGDGNTATGFNALLSNTEGSSNTATGVGALGSNTAGAADSAMGFSALQANTIGGFNTAIGSSALSVATGSENIAVGNGAGVLVTTANNVICIGAAGSDQSDSCYIGNIFAKQVALDGVPVLVDSLGKLGVQVSSRRFKEDIQPMEKASETILALKPVTFHYKSDANRTRCFGLIAEEVAEVNPDLVVRDERSELLTVRYDQVNAMLLNEFLKEHRTVQEQGAMISELKKEIASLTTTVKNQAAQIQKVSGQVQISTRPRRIAANSQP